MSIHEHSKIGKWFNRLTAAGFVVAICLPFCDNWFGLDHTNALGEKRKLAERPKLSMKTTDLKAFPAKFDDYYRDHFGFRNKLIYWDSAIKVKWLGVSPIKTVIVGKDGWLFLGDEVARRSYRGIPALTGDELARFRRELEKRQNWLAKRGIKFLFVVAPDKHTIYPEYLPSSYRRLRQNSYMDQLFDYLHKNTKINFIDLRPQLIEAKRESRVYRKTDTHWAQRTSFLVSESIVGNLLGDAERLSVSDTECTERTTPGGDLAGMLGMRDLLPETQEIVTLRESDVHRTLDGVLKPEGKTYAPPFAMECDDNRHPLKAVIFHDSFGAKLVPYLSAHFKRSTYIWQTAFDERIVEHEKPDVVILERAERFLVGGLGEFNPTDDAGNTFYTASSRSIRGVSTRNWQQVAKSNDGTVLWRMALPGIQKPNAIKDNIQSVLNGFQYRQDLTSLNWYATDLFKLPANIKAGQWAVAKPDGTQSTIVQAESMHVKWNHTSDPTVLPGKNRGWVYLFWDGIVQTIYNPHKPGVYQLDFRVSGSLPPPLEYAVKVAGVTVDEGTIPIKHDGDTWHLFSHTVMSDSPVSIGLAYTSNRAPAAVGSVDGDRNMWIDKLSITPLATVLVTTSGDAPSQTIFDKIRELAIQSKTGD